MRPLLACIIVGLSPMLVGVGSALTAHAEGIIVAGTDANNVPRIAVTTNLDIVTLTVPLTTCQTSGLRNCSVIRRFTGTCAATARSTDNRSVGIGVDNDGVQAKRQALTDCGQRSASACQILDMRCDALTDFQKSMQQWDKNAARNAVELQQEAERNKALRLQKEAQDLAERAAYNATFPNIPTPWWALPGSFLIAALGLIYGLTALAGEPRLSKVDTRSTLVLVSATAGGLLGLAFYLYAANCINSPNESLRLTTRLSVIPLTFFVSLALYRSLSEFPAFVRGALFLYRRHPAEHVVAPALRRGQPIDGDALADSIEGGLQHPLRSARFSWFQHLRAKRLAERTEAAAMKMESERDVYLAAERLERARAEERVAKQALAQAKKESKENRK